MPSLKGIAGGVGAVGLGAAAYAGRGLGMGGLMAAGLAGGALFKGGYNKFAGKGVGADAAAKLEAFASLSGGTAVITEAKSMLELSLIHI
mgnify:CR=1 FL=1